MLVTAYHVIKGYEDNKDLYYCFTLNNGELKSWWGIRIG
jgi:hypothetical protein